MTRKKKHRFVRYTPLVELRSHLQTSSAIELFSSMAPMTAEAKANQEQAGLNSGKRRNQITSFGAKTSLWVWLMCFLGVAFMGLYLNLSKEEENVNDNVTDNATKNSVEQGVLTVTVPRELVLCVTACNATFYDPALVRRGRPGSTDQTDVKAASYPLAETLSKPREIRLWDVRPFTGPYLVIVSTRPENKAARATIRTGWGNPKHYPRGTIRLIFFVRAFPRVRQNITWATKELQREADRFDDMVVEDFNRSSIRALMLEYAPAIANATRLLLWARDSFVVQPGHLFQMMSHLGKVAGDVFGRAVRFQSRGTQVHDDVAGIVSDWNQLEQCAYFLKMPALLRMANNYEDQPPKLNQDDEYELITPPLARTSNLTFVAGNFLPGCPDGHGSQLLPRVTKDRKARKMR